MWGAGGTPFRFAPLRPLPLSGSSASRTASRRAPPPILVRGWTSPPAPHTPPSMHQAATFSPIFGISTATGSAVIGLPGVWTRAYLRRLWARATKPNSTLTLAIPLRRKRLKPWSYLMSPKTASGSMGRILLWYKPSPLIRRSLAFARHSSAL